MAEQKKVKDSFDIDNLIQQAVFGADEKSRDEARHHIQKTAREHGIFPASIQSLYEARNQYQDDNL
jgi:hypothetical protein